MFNMDVLGARAKGGGDPSPADILGLPSYKELRHIITEIESSIKTYDPLDLVASLAFENLSFSTGRNPPDDGGQAYVEYLAILCLKAGQLRGTNRSIPPALIAELQSKVQTVFNGVAFRRARSRKPSSSFERARQYAELMFLSIRNLDDFDDLEQLLSGLFSDEAGDAPSFDAHFGFSAWGATKLPRSVGDIVNRQMALRQSQGHDLLCDLKAAARNDNTDTPVELRVLFNHTIRQQERDDLLLGYVAQRTFTALADVYSFQISDLAQTLSLDEGETRRLLDAFSMTFGDVGADFSLPTPSHDFLFRPIIKSERGYFCPIPDLLLWSVRPRLEELLKTDSRMWDAYQKRRANFLVQQSAALFEKVLLSPTVLKNLKYSSDQFSEDRTMQEYELDLAILFNGIAFLVECKGGTLPIKARSGKSRPARDAIEDLILDPSSQLDRARRHIEASANAVFELPSGVSVVISRNGIDQFFLVALTLEDINLFAADPTNLPVVEGHAEGTVPWIVNLLTLQAISQFIQFPAEFVHYLSRRLRLNTLKKVTAIEELDYFGNYLETGLHFDEAKIEKYDQVALDGFTEPIEEYRRFETGRSHIPVEKPRQKLPTEMATILADLQKINSRPAMQVSLLLLDMSGNARTQVAQSVSDSRQKSEKDGRTHNFSTLSKNGKFGLTFMSAKQLSSSELLDRLTEWCRHKIKSTSAKHWGGIASIVGQDGIAHECVFLRSR